MRPDICAEPMLRAPRPETVSASTLTGAFDGAGGVCAEALKEAANSKAMKVDERRRESLVFMVGESSLLRGLAAFGLGGRLGRGGLRRFGLLRVGVGGVGGCGGRRDGGRLGEAFVVQG